MLQCMLPPLMSYSLALAPLCHSIGIVTTVTPNPPFTTLSDHVHMFTTHSTVCTYVS